jgi:hypothetical protein
MTSDTSPRPISPLRARMIEDMSVCGFKEDTRATMFGRCGRLQLHRPVDCSRYAGIRNPNRYAGAVRSPSRHQPPLSLRHRKIDPAKIRAQFRA